MYYLRKVTISIYCSLVAHRKFECFSIHHKSDISSRTFSILEVNFRNWWSIWDVNIGGNLQFQISFDFLSQRRDIFNGCLMIEFQFFCWRIFWPGVWNQKVIRPWCRRFQRLFVAHLAIQQTSDGRINLQNFGSILIIMTKQKKVNKQLITFIYCQLWITLSILFWNGLKGALLLIS